VALILNVQDALVGSNPRSSGVLIGRCKMSSAAGGPGVGEDVDKFHFISGFDI
jgi:hypothetical protein